MNSKKEVDPRKANDSQFTLPEQLYLKVTKGQFRCGCHYHPKYGIVVMAGCPNHD